MFACLFFTTDGLSFAFPFFDQTLDLSLILSSGVQLGYVPFESCQGKGQGCKVRGSICFGGDWFIVLRTWMMIAITVSECVCLCVRLLFSCLL